jgi:HEXXH motif-containing protein
MCSNVPPWILDDTIFAPISISADRKWLGKRLSKTSPEIKSRLAREGLVPGEVNGGMPFFVAASDAIEQVSDLAEIIMARVAHIHILESPPGYDISHSEPFWPNRIFVSIPERPDQVGALRLAESIIHEAMHLHLTFFELKTPLVRDLIGQIQSPWRKAPRPYGGVLHGLFVFVCLREYFIRIANAPDAAGGRHLHQRVDEIDADINQIEFEQLAPGLTDAGRALLTRLMTVAESGD